MPEGIGDLVEYLAGKGYQAKQATGPEVKYPCFFDCDEPADSRKRKLYLNTEEGFYHCKVCGAYGGTTLLLRHFGDDPGASPLPSADWTARRRILNAATEVGVQLLANDDDTLLELIRERGLSEQTIVDRRLGRINGRRSLVGDVEASYAELDNTGLVYRDGPRKGQDFFTNHILIPYISRGQVVQLRGKEPGGKYMTGPGESVRLFNTDSLDDAEDVIVTEGEFDCIALEQHLRSCPEDRLRTRTGVVGLPGAGGLPANFDSYLSGARRVFIGFDPDDAGKRFAVKIKEQLGSRARIIELPETLPKCDWCVDDQTEALSRRGWLGHDEVEVGDELWSVDPATGLAGWRQVRDVYRKQRSRGMVSMRGRYHDSLTTNNHRWLVQDQGGNPVWRETDTLRLHDRVMTSAPPEPSTSVHSDDFVELVAWFYTEGWYHKRSRPCNVGIGQSVIANPEHEERIRLLLKRLYGEPVTDGYGPRGQRFWREATNARGITMFALSTAVGAELDAVAPGKVPIPEFLASLTAEQAELFVDTSVDADGHRKGETRIFTQVSEERIRVFEMACLMAGLTPNTGPRAMRGFKSGPGWTCTVRSKGTVLPRHTQVERVHYEGEVWCPVVEGTTTWLARRNGKHYFTGNTEFLLPVPADADSAWHAKHPHAGHTWRDVADLLSNAPGKRVFSVGDAARKWRSRENASTGLQTGWSELDATIHPGMLPGQVCILLAKTGTGKTIWLCNLAYNARLTPTLFISLEQTQEEVYERLRRIYLFHEPRATDAEIEQAFALTMICDENRLNEADMANLIDEFEVEAGARPELVLVDYLGYYAKGMQGGTPYEKTSNAVMQLKAEAKKHRVVVVAPHQVNRLAKEGKPLSIDDARDSGVVEETADYMLSIFRPDDALDEDSEPTGKLRMELNKSRHGGKGKVFSLQMDLLTLAVVDDGTDESRRAKHHSYLCWRGMTYDALRKEQTKPIQEAIA